MNVRRSGLACVREARLPDPEETALGVDGEMLRPLAADAEMPDLATSAGRSIGFTPRKDHIGVLDGLRGIAVALVLWSHCESVTARTVLRFADYVLQPGYLGVDLFFVLSGFLITRILLANKLSRRPISHFLIRRFLRIFPIYYLSLMVVGLISPGVYLVWCALYLSNFYVPFAPPFLMGHTWSLAVEEHFYLLWPWLVYGLSVGKSRAVALWGFLPLAVVAAIVVLALKYYVPAFHQLPAGKIIYTGSIFRASSLALGALLAYHENWLRANVRHVRMAFAYLFVPAVLILPTGEFVFEPLIPLAKMVGFSLLCGAALVAVIGLREAQAWPARVLRGRVLTFVGRISYGLYLYHAPIFTAFGVVRHREATVGEAVLAVVVTFAVATGSFYLVEQPILKLKERFQ